MDNMGVNMASMNNVVILTMWGNFQGFAPPPLHFTFSLKALTRGEIWKGASQLVYHEVWLTR